MITTISEHTIDISLLSGGIYVGCLGFGFSKAIKDLGCKVYAFDLEDMLPPYGIAFIKTGVSVRNSERSFIKTQDRQGYFLADFCDQGERGLIEQININLLYDILGNNIDVLKIDCEGEEYRILSDVNFRPIPKQITVEFHMHSRRDLHDYYYAKCIENLAKYYNPVKHELTEAHGAGKNYWDSLWVHKGLV